MGQYRIWCRINNFDAMHDEKDSSLDLHFGISNFYCSWNYNLYVTLYLF